MQVLLDNPVAFHSFWTMLQLIFKICLVTSWMIPKLIESHAVGDMTHCQVDQDCQNVRMCTRGEPCECFQFSPQILGPRCVKLSWAAKIRAAAAASRTDADDDVGPDTCGQDRKKLGKWYESIYVVIYSAQTAQLSQPVHLKPA